MNFWTLFFHLTFVVGQLSSLQNQNAMLFQRENELLARLASQEALQCELETLKQVLLNLCSLGEEIIFRCLNIH